MEEAHIPNTKKPSASTPKHSTFFQYFLWGGGGGGGENEAAQTGEFAYFQWKFIT